MSRAAARVVSLVPSVTETLLAWEVTPVGVTRFCEAPGVPKVGGTKNPDTEAIRALEPDLVIMDKEENRLEDAEALEDAGVRLLVTDVRSVDDVNAALAAIAEAVGAGEAPQVAPSRREPEGPRVWVPIWRRPWMSINGRTYGGSVLRAAGFVNVFDGAADPYPKMELEEVAARQAEFVLAPSEPYSFKERHRAQLETVAPAEFVDGQDLFWWGVRSTAAVGRLGELADALRARQVSGTT